MSTILLFHTISELFQCEKKLKDANIPSAPIPVPRNLSSDCGTSLQIHDNDTPKLKQLLEKSPLGFKKMVENIDL